MRLLVNGCSCTWGEELVSVPERGRIEPPEDTQERVASAWGGRLASKLNISDHINIARQGNGNARIARTTIKYIVNQPKESWQDLFVCIGWSSVFRHEMYVNDVHRWINILPNFNLSNKPSYIRKIEDFFQRNMMNRYPCYEYFYMHVLSLQSFFKSNNIKYLFFPVFDIEWDFSTDFYPIQNAIDTKCFMTFKQPNASFHTIIEKLPEISKYKLTDLRHPLKHPTKLGHEIWAERLFKYIKRNEIL